MSSCYEFNSYGCRRPSDTPVCYLCTCEQCGNILNYGTFLNCNSGPRNSFTYDPIPESFNEVQIIPSPSPRNGAHVGYNCPPQVPSFQTLLSFLHQYPCCEDCGVLPEADHCQPPQYTVNHPIFNVYNDLLNSQNVITIAQNKLMKQMTQLTSICEMACQIVQKRQEEKQIEEERAANA
nr:hypothetical protein [Tanacetum cinerariifolium]